MRSRKFGRDWTYGVAFAMLHEFLSRNREELIGRCRAKVTQRTSPKPTAEELAQGVPLFLDQLIRTLSLEQRGDAVAGLKVSGPSGGGEFTDSEVEELASLHGGELMKRGFTVEQVVHDYGDLCQAVTDLAFERNEQIEVHEFRSLNRCLDNAIAKAVKGYNFQRDYVVAEENAQAFNVRIGFFAHELRNFLNTATLAISAIKDGDLGISGATGAVLDRALLGMRSLIDLSLAEVRMSAELPPRNVVFALSDLVQELKLSATLEAQLRGCMLIVSPVALGLALDADRDLLLSAVGNLLQNAFKFTRKGTEVALNAYCSVEMIFAVVAA
jgi:signal transduction histidine kinase